MKLTIWTEKIFILRKKKLNNMIQKKIITFLTDLKAKKLQKKDPEIYNIAMALADVMFSEETTGFMIATTKLVSGDDGNDTLKHNLIIGRGFKADDIIPSVEQYNILADGILNKDDKPSPSPIAPDEII